MPDEHRIANLMAVGMTREQAIRAIDGDRRRSDVSVSSGPSATRSTRTTERCVSCGQSVDRYHPTLYRSRGGVLCGPCYGDMRREGADFWG